MKIYQLMQAQLFPQLVLLPIIWKPNLRLLLLWLHNC